MCPENGAREKFSKGKVADYTSLLYKDTPNKTSQCNKEINFMLRNGKSIYLAARDQLPFQSVDQPITMNGDKENTLRNNSLVETLTHSETEECIKSDDKRFTNSCNAFNANSECALEDQHSKLGERRQSKFRICRPAKLVLKDFASNVLRDRTTSSMWKKELDPFQVFQVEHESCLDFVITIHRGEGITKGSVLKDYFDTPDPYLILKIPGSSNCSKRTKQLDNTVKPQWDETFHFYLDPSAEHTLHITLMDGNYTLDETLGEDTFIVNTLTDDVPLEYTFTFQGGSKVYATLLLTKNKHPDLRFSLALCEKEREFLVIRRKVVLLAMKKLLGSRAPDNDKQVPIIAVLGSGGGFRAMMCMSGVVRGLIRSGVLQCATYISGLSGSSWYISTLYSHPSFPNVNLEDIHMELKESVTSGWKSKLTNSPYYLYSMLKKYRNGQPISFTDFFGHLLGDVLLKERKNALLSAQQQIVSSGAVPFPLYTCLHAKRSVSCRAFSEWVEFTPYEIGIAKYGTFMKTEHFGSKFMVGKLIKKLEEPPLHYLQGVWGSAFTILIKRLVLEGSGNKDYVQVMRENADINRRSEREFNESVDNSMVNEPSESDTDDENDISGADDFKEDEQNLASEFQCMTQITPIQETINSSETNQESGPVKTANRKFTLSNLLNPFSGRSGTAEEPKRVTSLDQTLQKKPKEPVKKVSAPVENFHDASRLTRKGAVRTKTYDTENRASSRQKWAERRQTRRLKREEAAANSGGIIADIKKSLMTSSGVLNSRAGRAGEILNPFRGLSLRNSFPLSPFADCIDDEDEVDCDGTRIGAGCRYQQLDNKAKKLFIVDSGLAFNSPYPLLLRPQRAVDIYLSFDFSMRKRDKDPPFKELLLAEDWARQNKVNFPPIKKLVEEFNEEPCIREVYVFKNDDDPYCPVILHFPIINHNFKMYKAPGVLRTAEELDFADFKIFDDKNHPYNSTNFLYEELQFQRMVELFEFNTLNSLDVIKDEIALAVQKKKTNMRKLGLMDVSSMLTRIQSLRSSLRRGSGLRINISENVVKDLQEQQQQMEQRQNEGERSNSFYHSLDDSDTEYTDAVEDL